jgi:hypothetical protein
MSANKDPMFSRQGDLSTNSGTGMAQPITLAANDFTGAGANNVLVFTADSSNGGFISRLRLKAAGSNVASVLRIFINNGATNATATNNLFFGEIALPITTALASGNSGPDLDYPLNLALNPGFRIYVGLGTAVAGGWVVTPVAGRY